MSLYITLLVGGLEFPELARLSATFAAADVSCNCVLGLDGVLVNDTEFTFSYEPCQ